jgi:hypothetical protein
MHAKFDAKAWLFWSLEHLFDAISYLLHLNPDDKVTVLCCALKDALRDARLVL